MNNLNKIMSALLGQKNTELADDVTEKPMGFHVNPLSMFEDKIKELKKVVEQESKQPEQPSFELLYLKTIENFFDYVGNLPASETDHHSNLWGLFTHSLEVAILSIKEAQRTLILKKNYPNHEERRLRESRLIFAIFFSGLTHDIGKIYNDMRVYSKCGDTWCPLSQSLADWSDSVEKPVKFRFIRRQYSAHSVYNTLFITKLLSPEASKFLFETEELMTEIITCFQFVRFENKSEVKGMFSDVVNFCDRYSSRTNKRKSFDEVGNEIKNSTSRQIENCVLPLYTKCDPCVFINIGGEVFAKYDSLMLKVKSYLENDKVGDNIIIEQLEQLGFIDNDKQVIKYYWFYENVTAYTEIISLLNHEKGQQKLKVIRTNQRIESSDKFERLKTTCGLLKLNQQKQYRVLTHNGFQNHLIFDKVDLVNDTQSLTTTPSNTNDRDLSTSTSSDIVDHIYANYSMFEDAKAILKEGDVIMIKNKGILIQCLQALLVDSPLNNFSNISEDEVVKVVNSLPTVLG
jgi:hypothetical protein